MVTGEQAAARHVQARDLASKSQAERAQRLTEIEREVAAREQAIQELLYQLVPELEGGASESALRLRAATVSPGDIVSDGFAEPGRSLRVTAAMIQASVRYRHQLIQRIARNPQGRQARELVETAATREALQA